MLKNIRKGFTIVELVIVIAVIAILAGVLIPTFSSVTRNAKKSAAMQQAKNAMEATLALTGGSYPDGTDFVVTESTANGKVKADYWFEYQGNKLTEADSGKPEAYESADGYYAVYFSSKCFEGEKAADNLKASLALLEASIQRVQGMSKFKITATSLGTATSGGYYELTVAEQTGTDACPAASFRIYFTSDIEPSLIIIMGKNY